MEVARSGANLARRAHYTHLAMPRRARNRDSSCDFIFLRGPYLEHHACRETVIWTPKRKRPLSLSKTKARRARAPPCHVRPCTKLHVGRTAHVFLLRQSRSSVAPCSAPAPVAPTGLCHVRFKNPTFVDKWWPSLVSRCTILSTLLLSFLVITEAAWN